MGTYSSATEAAKKQAIDKKIVDSKAVGKPDMNDPAYLKSLVSLASGGKRGVSAAAKGLQFFIIKGGGEGFLDASYSGVDASRMMASAAPTTTLADEVLSSTTDDNDLLAVFSKQGKLIGSALLERPVIIITKKDPHKWTESTANRVYNAWDGQSVSLYRNTNFDVRYFGLRIADSLGWYSSGHVRVDIHKQEATNGCIFIIDPNTPAYGDAKLNDFEPKLIRDIQAEISAKEKSDIGTMFVIEMT